MLEHLLSEQQDTLEFIAAETRAGRRRAATLATGGLEAYRDLWAKLHPPERPVVQPDEPFRDPADIKEPQR